MDELHYNFLAVQAVMALSPRQNHDCEPSHPASLPMHATCKATCALTPDQLRKLCARCSQCMHDANCSGTGARPARVWLKAQGKH